MNAVTDVVESSIPPVNIIWEEVKTQAEYITSENTHQLTSVECLWSDNLSGCLQYYVDDGCGDGTVFHTLSGLCWQKDLGASGTLNWTNAVLYCDNLVLCSDGTWNGSFSTPGTCSDSVLHDDWYLPSLNEWSFIRDLATGGAPYIIGSDGSGSSTLFDNYPGSSQSYWTSSGGLNFGGFAWLVGLDSGSDGWDSQDFPNRAVCSRWNS